MYFWKQIPDIQAQRVFIESYLYGVWMIYKQEKRWEKLNSSIKRSATRVCLLLLRKSSILLQIMLFYKLQIFITYFGSFHSFYSIFSLLVAVIFTRKSSGSWVAGPRAGSFRIDSTSSAGSYILHQYTETSSGSWVPGPSAGSFRIGSSWPISEIFKYGVRVFLLHVKINLINKSN